MTVGKRDVHVTPRSGGGWSVQRSGASRASSVHDTPGGRCRRGETARPTGRGGVNLHGRNGQVREKDSFGNDPHPPQR
jgi:hypothetical protein